MPKFIVAFLILALAPSLLFAGETLVQQSTSSTRSSVGLQGARSAFSLFDPSRFHMSHSYSVSFFSGGGQSNTIAMYLNRMDYDLTSNLHLTVGLGWLHQPQAALGLSEQTISNQIYPSVRLDWQPSSKFHLQINYQTLSPYHYYQNGYLDDPYWGSRYERERQRELQE